MTEPLIDTYDELLKRHLRPIPGTTHSEWVPWSELREQCTPQFRAAYDRRLRAFLLTCNEEYAAHVRRYIAVATRKYRARKRRK